MVKLSLRPLFELPRALKRKSSPNRQGVLDIEDEFRSISIRGACSGNISSPHLPVELILAIFEHLPVVDLIRCRSVCKYFQNLIDDTPGLQYLIELYATGYVDNPLCKDKSPTDRRQALQNEAHFWRRPIGKWQRTGFPWSVTYDDMRNTNWDDNLWVRFKKAPGVEEGKWNALECVLFQPVDGEDPVAERWELTFQFSFVCVTGNPSESMVVLLDLETEMVQEHYVIWKVSVRDGTVLSRHVVPFECPLGPEWAEPEISVNGKGVVITRVTNPGVDDAHAHVTVLDLETCSNIYTITRIIRGPSLVATQHADGNTVLLHMMKDGKFETEVHAVITSNPTHYSPTYTKLRHVATLEYPRVKRDLITPTNGFITGSSGGGLMPSISVDERPFIRSVVNPLIFLIRYHQDSEDEVTRVTHVFPLSVIQSLVTTFKDTGVRQQVPWSQWGPQTSRCFVDHSTVITGAYGSQILLSDWKMLEFNPQAISFDLMRVGKSPSSKSRKRLRLGRPLRNVQLPEGGKIIRRPTVYRKGQVFDQKVATYLPYRETQLGGVPADSVLVFGGEVWVACATETGEDGVVRHNCYTLSR